MAVTTATTKVVLALRLIAGTDSQGQTKLVSMNMPAVNPETFDNAKAWAAANAVGNYTTYTLAKVQKTEVANINNDM